MRSFVRMFCAKCAATYDIEVDIIRIRSGDRMIEKLIYHFKRCDRCNKKKGG